MPSSKNDAARGETPASLLRLLQTAVASKVAYWDAMTALETALADGKELTDSSSDNVDDGVESLAVGLDASPQAFDRVTLEHLATLQAKVRVV